MADPLEADSFSILFGRLAVQAEARAAAALSALAVMTERQAKVNASTGEHPYGTPTPSSGDPVGPARISGTLVRSVTHTEAKRTATGWEALVGLAAGLYPNYNRKTPSSKYGYYLEVTGAGGKKRYPFLVPALHYTHLVGTHVVFRAAFGGAWSV